MTSVIPARRRAEEFAGLVETSTADDSRYAEMLGLVDALRSTQTPVPRPEHVAELRALLMAEADEALGVVDRRLALPVHTRTRRDRRIAVAVGAVVVLGASSSMAVAAQDALPGDALYPIKRALESAQTTLRTDNTDRAALILDNASGRLAEASELARRGGAAEAELPTTLEIFTAQAREAADLLLADYAETGDAATIEELRAFTAVSMDALAALDAVVPIHVHDELNAAALALAQIDDMAAAACPSCAGGITELPRMFLLAAGPEADAPHVAPQPVLEKPSQVPAPDEGSVTRLLDELTGTGSKGGDGTAKTTEPAPAAAPEPAPEATDEESKTLIDLTDELTGSGDGEDGLVNDLLEGPVLGPVTGENGLLSP